MKVRDLEKLENTIYDILVNNENARKDDMYLYYAYCRGKWALTNNRMNFTIYLEGVFEDKNFRQRFKIASFTSVERARRKVQEKYPELKANIEARVEEEETYKEYARNNYTII